MYTCVYTFGYTYTYMYICMYAYNIYRSIYIYMNTHTLTPHSNVSVSDSLCVSFCLSLNFSSFLFVSHSLMNINTSQSASNLSCVEPKNTLLCVWLPGSCQLVVCYIISHIILFIRCQLVVCYIISHIILFTLHDDVLYIVSELTCVGMCLNA